ncbi:NADH-quinone oxidoreductase subunit J [Gordonia sp. HY002]|uniref:NADH-quinone oxidoreductase subunit J n=1 Tax=Gordonia zhenghanii TaxID=2911516 RepID=UPI001EF07140|nr:NADH-quinone oxidoreductase subunit J [Gordonia zhenghanii]MCF8569427.1 NADH-quinone oxidoreductase subunit J [Gordonia zhenghanii]MCF8602402.1 NADH-quinone oxidoreductase subunit J [Gordonia zhenghanii]
MTTTLAAGLASTSGTEAVTFWILGVIVVIGALGVVLSPKAVYSAVFLAMTMIIFAVFYVMQGALFLGVVQVVVYTGAVMMLFLFVLMLIGVDSSDSLVEAVRGQRIVAIGLSLGFGVLLVAAIGSASIAPFVGAPDLSHGTAPGGGNENIRALAEIIFVRYLWAFELTGALLITATLGAMVLAHRQRTGPVQGQRELSVERFKRGGQVTPLPAPGVYARHNAVDIPGRLPDGSPSRLSVNQRLTPRVVGPSGNAITAAPTAGRATTRPEPRAEEPPR